jgi:RND family efflux transporter MFP subunit
MTFKQLLKRVLSLLALCALVGFVSACSRGAAQQAPPPPPAVTIAPVQSKEIVEWDEFTGRVEPVESVEVRPRVSGYIEQIRFNSGQLVRKGDVLVVIDPRWHKAEYDRRKADLEQATTRVDNARREAERTRQLLETKAISIEEGDARQARYDEAKAAQAAAQAALDSATLDLEYTQVRAPIDGRVSRALLTEGNYVSGVAGAATMLTTIVSVDPVYVYADMDENSLLKFNALARARQLDTNSDGKVPVELQLADEKGFLHQGQIESFDNRLDANTGSILLRAVFHNPDGKIMPGLFARIRVPLSERHPAMLVEERAIGTDQAQKFVFGLTATNTVEYRIVKIGPLVDGKRIIREGLEPGQSILVNGIQRVRPGMAVTPQVDVAAEESASRALVRR